MNTVSFINPSEQEANAIPDPSLLFGLSFGAWVSSVLISGFLNI
jgi:hypothetical protein